MEHSHGHASGSNRRNGTFTRLTAVIPRGTAASMPGLPGRPHLGTANSGQGTNENAPRGTANGQRGANQQEVGDSQQETGTNQQKTGNS